MTGIRVCACMGPQRGEPLCPCKMRQVEVKNGRYERVIDYGPTPFRYPPRPTRDERIAELEAELARLRATPTEGTEG